MVFLGPRLMLVQVYNQKLGEASILIRSKLSLSMILSVSTMATNFSRGWA